MLRKELALKTGHLMFITQQNEHNTLQEQLEGYVKGGGRLLQLRLKGLPKEELTRIAEHVVEVMQTLGGSVIINDYWDVAQRTRAWGVHIGQGDGDPFEVRKAVGEEMAIGVTVNTLEQLIALKDAPIDYVGLGPLRFTRTKEKIAPLLGMEGVRKVVEGAREAGVSHPIFVIGGVENLDVYPLLELGVHGVAVSGSIASASNASFATEKFMDSVLRFLRKPNATTR